MTDDINEYDHPPIVSEPPHDAYSLRARARQSILGRWCFVCAEPIAAQEGLVEAELLILVHRQSCAKAVNHQRRIYDRSKRGRLRCRSEILARVLWAYEIRRMMDERRS